MTQIEVLSAMITTGPLGPDQIVLELNLPNPCYPFTGHATAKISAGSGSGIDWYRKHFDASPEPEIVGVAAWMKVLPKDYDGINALANKLNPNFPERDTVFVEKFSLYPEGCKKFANGGTILGYGIAHPWTHHDIPPLDAYLGGIPDGTNCLHIHDLAISPEAGGNKTSSEYIKLMERIAEKEGFRTMSCVAVHGSEDFWESHRFFRTNGHHTQERIKSYGDGALYMVKELF